MKKLPFLFLSLLLVLLLAACGTAEDQNIDSDDATKETEEETTTVKEEVATENNAEQEDTVQPENQIQYTSNNEEHTADTNIVEEEQYTIQVLDGYELTKEEPGKELLFLKDNDAINMRIEVVPKSEANFEDLVKNTEETMATISDYEPFDISEAVKKHSDITNSASYIATIDNDEVVGIVYEKGNLLVRLTVFDQKDDDLKDALIQMGLTIQEK